MVEVDEGNGDMVWGAII